MDDSLILPVLSVSFPRHTVTSATGGGALQAEEAAAVPLRSVPVLVAYELQQAGHRYLDVR
jgi:hypothetical protein